jgi:hypothetical protein
VVVTASSAECWLAPHKKTRLLCKKEEETNESCFLEASKKKKSIEPEK